MWYAAVERIVLINSCWTKWSSRWLDHDSRLGSVGKVLFSHVNEVLDSFVVFVKLLFNLLDVVKVRQRHIEVA